MKPVLNKTDFAQRYANGEFGNAAPTWSTVEEFVTDDDVDESKLYHLRNRIKGGDTWYNLKANDLKFFRNRGNRNFYVSEMAPTEKTILQGEVRLYESFAYDLFYSTIAKPMRQSLAEGGKHMNGLAALQLLQRNLDANSFSWLQHLFTEYPGHIIEFSTYSEPWGTCPYYNTVFWEVRKY